MLTARIVLVLLCSLSLVSEQAIAKSSSKKPCPRGEADYVIVGLGTAGSVLARELSNPTKGGNFKNSVLVLEVGQNRSNDPVIAQGPAFLFNNIDDLAFNSKYAITKVAADSSIPPLLSNQLFSSGRLWFGTSAHNFMFAARGSSDRWDDLAAAVGDSQWSYNNLLPFMNALETYHGTTTTPADRGFNGPLQISQASPIPKTPIPFQWLSHLSQGLPLPRISTCLPGIPPSLFRNNIRRLIFLSAAMPLIFFPTVFSALKAKEKRAASFKFLAARMSTG